MRDERGTASTSPIEEFLIDLHQRVSDVGGGKIADYIPELGKADADTFGMALATVDGETYATGDADHLFTIQSVSKPFMYGYALQHYGRDYVLRHVGVEPTGGGLQLDRARRGGQPAVQPYGQRRRRGRADAGRHGARAHWHHAQSVLRPCRTQARNRRAGSNPRTPAATATGPS